MNTLPRQDSTVNGTASSPALDAARIGEARMFAGFRGRPHWDRRIAPVFARAVAASRHASDIRGLPWHRRSTWLGALLRAPSRAAEAVFGAIRAALEVGGGDPRATSCRLTGREIAEAAGVSLRAVWRALRALRGCGAVTRQRVWRWGNEGSAPEGPRQAASVYGLGSAARRAMDAGGRVSPAEVMASVAASVAAGYERRQDADRATRKNARKRGTIERPPLSATVAPLPATNPNSRTRETPDDALAGWRDRMLAATRTKPRDDAPPSGGLARS